MELIKIGHINSPFKTNQEAPKDGSETDKISTIEVYPDFLDSMMGLEKYEEVLIVYWADQADRKVQQATSCKDGEFRGVFTLRCPHRPNPILTTPVKLVKIEGNLLEVRGLEALDGSPLLDIKPIRRRD